MEKDINFQGKGEFEIMETPEVGQCLWCGTELEKPYIDPESDGVIGYNWKLYCSLYCELNNEYE